MKAEAIRAERDIMLQYKLCNKHNMRRATQPSLPPHSTPDFYKNTINRLAKNAQNFMFRSFSVTFTDMVLSIQSELQTA